MEHWDEGVFVFQGRQARGAVPLIVSAGVHGDETAPVAVLEWLVQQIRKKIIVPQRPLLLIFANPAALLNGKRFVHTNLNRLFGVNRRVPGPESTRAQELEQFCRDFAELHGAGWHLDLHATIKPSRHVHFALMPACDRNYDDTWLSLLAACGFSALVRQRSPAGTFSHFTCTNFGYESFTLECGSLQATPQAVAAVLQPLLEILVQTSPFDGLPVAGLQRYQVVQDIIKQHADFHFLVDEQCDNFSTFAAGTALALDGIQVIKTPCDECALLFANSRVLVGDRAGLLLAPLVSGNQ